MARCCPLIEIVVINVAEAKRPDAMDCPAETACIVSKGEAPRAPNDDGRTLSARGTEDFAGRGVSDDENSQTYYFGASTITLGKINEMVDMGYFMAGEARALVVEAVPEPDNDEVVMYEDFLIIGLCMPPHPALVDVLLHVPTQLHQLTSNATAQLSKYFWAIGTFGGIPQATHL
jgi:hypothetical protein